MKWKRPLALMGLMLILAMYVIALLSAFFHTPESKIWLMAAILSTVIVPAIIYSAQLVCRVLRPKKNQREAEKEFRAP